MKISWNLQVSNIETAYQEISDIYDTTEDRGLSENCIQMIPLRGFRSSSTVSDGACCSICLQVNDWKHAPFRVDFQENIRSNQYITTALEEMLHLFYISVLDDHTATLRGTSYSISVKIQYMMIKAFSSLLIARSFVRTLRKERRREDFRNAGTSSTWIAWMHG